VAISESLGEPREVTLSQGKLAYRERGSGPPLVFLHGFPENGDGFRHVVPALSREYRCITPDWPWGLHPQPLGSGADLSLPGLAQLIGEFLDELGLTEVTLVGSGGGGTIAQIAAAEHPGRLASLVLMTGDSLEHFPARALRGFQFLTKSPFAVWVFLQLGRLRPARRFWFGLSSRSVPEDDDLMVRSYLRPLSNASVRREQCQVIGQLDSRYSLIAAGKLALLAKPTLLIWSSRDRFFPVEDAHALRELWPHARLEVLDHDRTFIAQDLPEQVTRVMQDFLAGVQRTSTSSG
jgi:pimeloyl-ACP methyl ester carboxylesterase